MNLKISVDTKTEAANRHLLRELDRWLKLGLVSEAQVVTIGQTLSSRLPIRPIAVAEEFPVSVSTSAPEPDPPISTNAERSPLFSRFKSRLVQSFLAEVSVLWLLFLGVFLVVVSSGVLAASQWQSFSAMGQYAILLLYTLAFGGASYWAAGQDKLQTTAQMLKAATLLLIPLNMWMMDALGILNISSGLASVGLAIGASIGLSLLTLVLAPRRRTGLNLLGLSWLHWGWGLMLWPLAATYLGTLGSATNLVWGVPHAGRAENKPELEEKSGGLLVAAALLILLVRSLWIAQVPVYQLGLACGICGWLLCRLHQEQPLWPQLGSGLLFVGWLVCVQQQPLQAMGVSGLAGWLLADRLQRQPEERQQLSTLATLWLVGLQACGLLWLSLPIDVRQGCLTAMGQLSSQPVSALNFAGVWLYGYVGLMLLGARRFRQQGRAAWSSLTEQLALGTGVLLVLLALPQTPSVLLTLSLIGLTLTLGALTRLRRPAPKLIYGTHSAAVVTVLSGLSVMGGPIGEPAGWTDLQWAIALLGLTLVEWLASVASEHYPEWRRSAWYLGIGLSAIAYGLLLNSQGDWLNLAWLGVPIALTGLVYRRQFATARPQVATILTVLALVGQLLLLSSWSMATVALAIGAGLLFLHSCRWSAHASLNYLPALMVGAAVAGVHTAGIWLWLTRQSWPGNVAHSFVLMAIVASVLSILTQWLNRQSRSLFRAYGAASDGWSRGIAVVLGLGLTCIVALAYGDTGLLSSDTEVLLRYGAAATTLLLARLFSERRLTDWSYWELAHGVGLLVAIGLALGHQGANLQLLGAAMVALGLVAQLLGTAYVARRQCAFLPSWHYIPLAYGALGLVLTHFEFTATTGFYPVVVGVVTLAIGRRNLALRSLGYGGLGLLSVGIYELVIYRLLQASGGEAGDGLTLLALVGGAIAAIELLGHRWIQRYTRLTNISVVSLLHWLLAVTLAAMAMVSGHSRVGVWLWLGVASLLALYAGLRGNYRWFPLERAAPERESNSPLSTEHHSHNQWTWSGLIILTIAIPYEVEQLLTNLTFIREWGALFVCGLSVLIYPLPWQRWGWPNRPWRRMALGWPTLAILLSVATVKTQSLLLVGAFYAAMAKRLRAVRLSYLSLGLLNWSLLRYLAAQGWLTPLWLGITVGASALYILEVDPYWQPSSARQERHRLRSLATLLMGLTAIFQAEGAAPALIGLSLLINFGFIGFGLVTQVRAYLYIGTLTFALQILRTIMMFISTDGRLLWAVGIALGMILIWVAATFEARRTQIGSLLGHWSEQLRDWD